MTFDSARITWRGRAARWLGVAAGALAMTVGSKPFLAEAATDGEGKSAAASAATQVPAAWQDFAKSLQRQIQDRLASNSDAALRFYNEMARPAAETKPTPSILVRVWIMSDGKLERIEIDGLPTGQAPRDLIAAVGGVNRPPSDMPQPVRLRLSLRAKDHMENQR